MRLRHCEESPVMVGKGSKLLRISNGWVSELGWNTDLIYQETQGVLKTFLEDLPKESVTYTEHEENMPVRPRMGIIE